MASLSLVQYDSDDEDTTPQTSNKTTVPSSAPQKTSVTQASKPNTETAPSAQIDKSKDVKDTSNGKRVIKYSALQTSKNLLQGSQAASASNEEWKPTSVDFSKKLDPNAQSDASTSKAKKANSFAANFFNNLPKPKRELTNISKGLVISDTYDIGGPDEEEVLTKKLKTEIGDDDDDDDLDDVRTLANTQNTRTYTSMKSQQVANLKAFTDEDKDVVYQYDKSNRTGPIGVASIVEVRADNLVDNNWELNAEKKAAGRMFNTGTKLTQPNKAAKSKNQLSAIAYSAVADQDSILAKNNESRERQQKTSNNYGW